MKRILSVFCAVLLGICLFSGCSSAPTGEVVTFEDAGFEALVRAVLGKAEGADITTGELETITCLRVFSSGRVVASTKQAKNVNEANSLTEGELRDFELETEFDGSSLMANIGSWAEMRYFTNLEDFEADDVPVDTLDFLAGMPNLANLALSGNHFSDLSAIGQCANLEFLSLRIPNMQTPVLPEDPSKLIYVYYESNALSDISGIAQCQSLLHFATAGDGVFDLSPLVQLPVLREVELRGEGITDIQVLKDRDTIESMTFSIDAIEDLESNVIAMVQMPKLRVLNLLSEKEFEGDTGQDWFASLDEATKNAINRLRSSNLELTVLINGLPTH